MSNHTIYGAAVAMIKGKEIYLCRRTENVIFPKKWQFVNGRLRNMEQSIDTAQRIIEEQTLLKIDKKRLFYSVNITVDESNEFYYLYLLYLNDNETPANTCNRWRGDWKLFPLERGVVLDVVPGIRPVIRGLHRMRLKFEASRTFELTPEQKKLKLIGPPAPQQQQQQRHSEEHIRQQLSQGEQLHLSNLDAKMTRALQLHGLDGHYLGS